MSFTVPQAPPIEDTYAPTTIIGRVLTEAMTPWLTLHLAWYLDAIGAMFEQVAQLVLDEGEDGDADYLPGYGKLLDPTAATGSELQFVGQFVGVQVPDGMDDTDARSLVIAEGGMQRGTPTAIIAAAKRQLSGTQSVQLIERYGPAGPDAYWFTIVVRPDEVVSLDDLTTAVQNVKPGGELFQIIQVAGYTWAQAIHEWIQDSQSWAQTAIIQP